MTTIGTCSICHGPVQVPDFWGGSVPPIPQCSRCGATAANPFGQVIPMRRHANKYEQEWQPTEQERKATELAERYHHETEVYDRAVCTGPIRDGSVIPINSREMALIIRNAIEVREQIIAEAARYGIGRRDMARAITLRSIKYRNAQQPANRATDGPASTLSI